MSENAEKIRRDNLKTKLDEINEKIDKLTEEKQTPGVYHTVNKYLNKHGYVHELEDVKACIRANTLLINHSDLLERSAKDLGEEIPEEATTLMGIEVSKWKEDIKLRLSEIKRQDEIDKLYKARKVLKRNLSEDDKFAMDMDKVDDILNG